MRRILHNVFSYAFIALFTIALTWAYVAPFVYERILNPLALLLGVPVVFILFIYAVKKVLATDEVGLKKYNRIIILVYLVFQAIILSMDTLNFSDGAEIENEAHYMLKILSPLLPRNRIYVMSTLLIYVEMQLYDISSIE